MLAYETGTATDPNDLLNKLDTFLQANGWASSANVSEGAGRRVAVNKAGMYFVFRSCIGETIFTGGTSAVGGIGMVISTAYSAGGTWSAQTGVPLQSGTAYATGAAMALPAAAIVAYHFFSDPTGERFMVVVEKTALVFTYLMFGSLLTKAGTWTGGAYCGGAVSALEMTELSSSKPGFSLTALCPFGYDYISSGCSHLSYILADVDTWTGKWVGLGISANKGYTGWQGASSVHWVITAQESEFASYANLQNYAWNSLNQQAIFLPIIVWAARAVGGWSVLGTIPDVFSSVAYANGANAGSLLAIGADNYMVFPNFVVRKY